MADSTASRRSRVSRGASSASSASSVSAETENKLARAAQSAQRLAQLSDAPHNDGTLDLFPDDPTRALVESMTIDVRQGTLSGFELPEVVRAAVEAAQGATRASTPTTPRRGGRAKEVVAAGADEVVVADAGDAGAAMKRAGDGGDAASVVTVEGEPPFDGEPAVEPAVQAVDRDASLGGSSAATNGDDLATKPAAPAIDRFAQATDGEMPVAGHAMPAASPALDRARATAFADTVDALYGVIADQRRAAADLTRRMKWMLAIVAGALLVMVGVGVAQTLLLFRLARDAAAQQQRTGQMLQTQQAALASLLQRAAAPVPASNGVATAPVTAHPAPTTRPSRHLPHGRHAHSTAR
jgi:hypothetical protein